MDDQRCERPNWKWVQWYCLVKFINETKESYSPNTIWVIFTCVNVDFIERFGVILKGLPRLKKFLNLQASKYVAKKSDTFSPQEIEQVLLYLQEKNCPEHTLYSIAISLLYFGLLRASEVREVEHDDVTWKKEATQELRLPLPMIGKEEIMALSFMSCINTIQCIIVM